MMNQNYADLRKEYTKASLSIEDTLENPIEQFQKWFKEAKNSDVQEPNAMTLSTVTAEMRPDARIVLVKDVQDNGFSFFTNYQSRKGSELEKHPYAALTFFWPELERQVRIEGTVVKLDDQANDTYFNSRPRGSQIGAWTSPQSQKITDRSMLEKRQHEFEERFEGQQVPRPDHWGGFMVKPERIEFWQGRPSRLHDRVVYTLKQNGWQRSLLAP